MFIICKGKSCRKKCCCTLKAAMTTLLMNIILPDLDTGFSAATAQRHQQQSRFNHLQACFFSLNINKISIRCKDCLIICGQAVLIKEPPIFKISEGIKYQRAADSILTVCLSITVFLENVSVFLTFSIEKKLFPLILVLNSTL